MPDLLEQELARTLARVEAQTSTKMPADLQVRVDRRFRARRRRRTAIAAASICALTALATILPQVLLPKRAANGVAVATAKPTASPTAAQPEQGALAFPKKLSGLPNPAQVWPGAFVNVPRTGNGGTYRVKADLDGSHLLLTWEHGFQNPVKLFSYDIRSDTTAYLAELKRPPGAKDYSVGNFDVSATEIVWTTAGDGVTSVWAVPKTGGTPRLVGKPNLHSPGGWTDLSDFAVSGDDLYWSHQIGGGVYRMSLRTGQAAPVPGMEQFRFVSFPWANDVKPERFTKDAKGNFDGGEVVGVATRVRNVLTGEEVMVYPLRKTVDLWCASTFCVGKHDNFTTFVASPDGSHMVEAADFMTGPDQVLADRLVAGSIDGGGVLLVDVTTGKAARATSSGASPARGGIVWWISGTKYGVLLAGKLA